ncbi:hypothetical protein ABD91_26005 [Lysinibacillus sphaericus]|uniref:lipoprotein n=1 Tax=Lysinibacillus sphaericus TaxID=1421 RepID=UPI0018CF80B3|nr:hypothetical protein [Lysinibacillus sphaericus]MBG9694187.1 hypothetical protein [Lysinibacillus sphaericus]
MKKLLTITSLTLLLSACNLTETAIIENVKLVDTDPFENCKSCSYGVFEKENGEQFKLPISDKKIKQMVKDTIYDIEYETKSFDYPDNEVINIFIK